MRLLGRKGTRSQMSTIQLPAEVAEMTARLIEDILDRDASNQLWIAITESAEVRESLGPRAADALADVCSLLEGHDLSDRIDRPPRPSKIIDRALHESLVIHPSEKSQRQHKLASVLGRILHLFEGDQTAEAISRVTEQASIETFPDLCSQADACAASLQLKMPRIHIARGEEKLFAPCMDKSPFVCLHLDYVFARPCVQHEERSIHMQPSELRAALGHQFEHIKSGHTPLLQLTDERLEALVLDQVPFLVRAPIRIASKAIGMTGANKAVKKVGDWLPDHSRSQRVVDTFGDLLPDRDQETILPDMVHDWVRSWIRGVEFSADRASLVVSGNAAAACSALIHLSEPFAKHHDLFRRNGLQSMLSADNEDDHAALERLRELVRFALSADYLTYISAGD